MFKNEKHSDHEANSTTYGQYQRKKFRNQTIHKALQKHTYFAIIFG